MNLQPAVPICAITRTNTEEVRSSNLLTPTIHSQLRGIVSGLFFFWIPRIDALFVALSIYVT